MFYSQPDIWNLRNLRLFENLTREELDQLSPLLQVRHYRRSEFLFHMGERADRLYFLREGAVRVSALLPEGEERILDIFRPGDTFGELFLSKDKRRIATAQAMADVTVYTMTEEAFMGLMRTRPDICLNFVRHLVDNQRRSFARLEGMIHAKAGVRLLAVLVDLAERLGGRTGDSVTLPTTIPQRDLALMTGLHRSTVSVLVNDYRRRGILGGQGGTITIHRTRAAAFLKKAGLMLS